MNLTRMSGLGVAASLATIAALAAPTAGHASVPVGGAAAKVTYYAGTQGVARLVPRSAHRQSPATVSLRQKGIRLLRTGSFSAREAVPGAPAAKATSGVSPLVDINGVSSLDSQVTNYNQKFEPPDQGLCEGNGFVLEPVNSAYRIYRVNGNSIRGPFNVNDLFNVGGKEFTSDPRCWYDKASGTWFATILFLNDTGTAGALLIAVRHAPDPLGLWNEYSINTTDIGNGCPCFGDQPRIGIDQDNLYVADDEFSIVGPQFLGAEIWAFDKADLVAGNPGVRFVRFPYLRVDGQLTLAPQPALATGKPGAEFFMSSLDFNRTGDHRIAVWAMTNRGAIARGGMPVLSSVVIRSEKYANPLFAPQKGSKTKLTPDDDRMQQTATAAGTVWGELTTAVRPAGDGSVRDGGAWFQVMPTIGPSGITGASIVRQGYVDAVGRYLLFPAVQPDAAGNAAMVFTITSKSMFPSAGFATLKAHRGRFGAPQVAAAGFGPYFVRSQRWGDYSFAVPDSSSDSAWLSTEYVPPKSSQTTNGHQNWGTRVIEIPLG